jgi:thiol-disulfide isomerase/thioredoxin
MRHLRRCWWYYFMLMMNCLLIGLSSSAQLDGTMHCAALPGTFYMPGDSALPVLRKIQMPGGQILLLQDANRNGTFNDADDKLVTGNSAYALFRPYRKNMLLAYGDTARYYLQDIDVQGQWIKMVKAGELYGLARPLPNFEFTDTAGKKMLYADLPRTKKYTVLYFWGSWCYGCRLQSDSVEAFYKRSASVCNFYSLNYADSKEKRQQYIREKNLSFPVLIADRATVQKAGIGSYPTFLLINAEGQIIREVSELYFITKFLE